MGSFGQYEPFCFRLSIYQLQLFIYILDIERTDVFSFLHINFEGFMEKWYNQKFFFVCFVFWGLSVSAQTGNNPAPIGTTTSSAKGYKQKLMPGVAFAYAVVNNRKEIRGQYKPGVNFSLYYLPRPWFALVGEYSWYFPHASFPALENIRSYNADLNGHVNMRIGESDLFFHTLFGLTYLNWEGTYIGPSSSFVDNNSYEYGALLKQQWIGVNLGCGFHHHFGKRIVGYGDFRVRFASEKVDLFSISDTAFQFGIRIDLGKDSDRKPRDKNAQTDEIASQDANSSKETSTRKSKKPKSKGIYRWVKKRR